MPSYTLTFLVWRCSSPINEHICFCLIKYQRENARWDGRSERVANLRRTCEDVNKASPRSLQVSPHSLPAMIHVIQLRDCAKPQEAISYASAALRGSYWIVRQETLVCHCRYGFRQQYISTITQLRARIYYPKLPSRSQWTAVNRDTRSTAACALQPQLSVFGLCREASVKFSTWPRSKILLMPPEFNISVGKQGWLEPSEGSSLCSFS